MGSTQKSRSGKATSGTGEKFSIPSGGQDTLPASNVASASPIASIDAIMALQGVDDSTTGNKKALMLGQDLLARLEEVRHGLLLGSIPVERLKRLQSALEGMDVAGADPKLAEIVRDIEVRAAVELAKLGF
ncbi:flagellar assembly protein FliX [Sneathiella chinensis]|uniref:Flagellar assembly protein FliX n=1 Tax=Sneathiella chinensis TaxID=349750 RepID=A0ABQ5U669_9PROT|nr:flagellar assembly protein FliX [Sneathiella chinensis]